HLADLDHKDFKVRDKASKELQKLGDLAAPALEKLRKDKPSLELANRIDDLIKRIDKNVLSVDDLQAHRAIMALKEIGNADAKAVLENLAKGADGALVTENARKALAEIEGTKK